MKRILAALAVAILSSCATLTTPPQTPAQAVYAVQGDYTSALTIAVAYKSLPPCVAGGTIASVLCSSPAIVATLQRADDAAFAALTAAQNIVRTPGAGVNVATALNVAQQAVAAFASITSTLQVPK